MLAKARAKPRKIGFITTIQTNIGDDLIRDGIVRILENALSGPTHESVVNKHKPLTVYKGGRFLTSVLSPLPRGRHRIERAVSRVFNGRIPTYFDDCDVVVQCGAPVVWPGCHNSEWAGPLWRDVVTRLHSQIPVLNLAAGSAFPWSGDPSLLLSDSDRDFIRLMGSACRLTTTRDRLAETLFGQEGVGAPLLPCAAFVAGTGQPDVLPDGPVLLNYMEGGGHWSWDQPIDAEKWRQTFLTVLSALQQRHHIVLLCHDRAEADLARDVAPEVLRLQPRTVGEYFAATSGAKAVLSNRVHAVVALAGVGIPGVAVGTDSRLLMAEALGLPVLYVEDASSDALIEMMESSIAAGLKEKERLAALKRDALGAYVELVRRALRA